LRGWTIVTDGGYGIAGAADCGALAAAGTTVAVVAGGIHRPYPPGHAELFDRISVGGLVVSQWLPDSGAERHHFPARRRLTLALGAGTVVVEAIAGDPVITTACRSWPLGRALMAVPGPITSAQSAGCHRLVQEQGARLVTSADDVLEIISASCDDLPTFPPIASRAARDRKDGSAVSLR